MTVLAFQRRFECCWGPRSSTMGKFLMCGHTSKLATRLNWQVSVLLKNFWLVSKVMAAQLHLVIRPRLEMCSVKHCHRNCKFQEALQCLAASGCSTVQCRIRSLDHHPNDCACDELGFLLRLLAPLWLVSSLLLLAKVLSLLMVFISSS